MNILFVIDSSVVINSIDWGSLVKGGKVFIFPLSSASAIIDEFAAKIDNIAGEIVILPVNTGGDELREKYLKFIAQLPAGISHRGRNLKEYFSVDAFASLWWFSLIAEKNTFKSDFFNCLAQLQALTSVGKYRRNFLRGKQPKTATDPG